MCAVNHRLDARVQIKHVSLLLLVLYQIIIENCLINFPYCFLYLIESVSEFKLQSLVNFNICLKYFSLFVCSNISFFVFDDVIPHFVNYVAELLLITLGSAFDQLNGSWVMIVDIFGDVLRGIYEG